MPTNTHKPINPREVVPIPDNINEGLTSPSNATLIQILGMPRDVIDHKHRGVTNQPLKSLIKTDDVGPFRVTGCRPAVESLKRVMRQIRKNVPEVYSEMSSAGMLVVRLIGGSSKISNHSWGCALDINMAGLLDGLGSGRRDGKTLAGLAAIAPYFHEEGWYWGVGFSGFEDGMHFEVAEQTLRAWQAAGEFGKRVSERPVHTPMITRGDKGQLVKKLQQALIEHGHDMLVDGDFGPITHAHVMNFQAEHGLVPDGVVGPKTWKALLAEG